MPQVPGTKVDVTKCHTCHAKRRWMSPSAKPATQSGAGFGRQKRAPSEPQSGAAPRATKARPSGHQSQPSAPSATPATQNEGGCHQLPHLPGKRRVPRKTKVDVTKYHAFHATRWWMSRLPRKSGAASAMRTTRNEEGCHQVPRMPCKAKVDVAKFHACQAKWRGAPGDQSAPKHATRASPVPQVPRLPRKTKRDPRLPGKVARPPSDQSVPKRGTRDSPVPQVLRLPDKTKVDVTTCHVSASSATPARVPRETKVDVSKCHACLAKCRWMSPSATLATQ